MKHRLDEDRGELLHMIRHSPSHGWVCAVDGRPDKVLARLMSQAQVKQARASEILAEAATLDDLVTDYAARHRVRVDVVDSFYMPSSGRSKVIEWTRDQARDGKAAEWYECHDGAHAFVVEIKSEAS